MKKIDKINEIIDEFLESAYFNELWEEQYKLLRVKLIEEFG